MLVSYYKLEEDSIMRILLADDYPEVRSALRLLLEQEPIQASVTEVSDAQELLAALGQDCPTIVLLDWELPGLHTEDRMKDMRANCPSLKVIALSSNLDVRQEALAAGADAFVCKAEPPEQILSALRSLAVHPDNYQFHH